MRGFSARFQHGIPHCASKYQKGTFTVHTRRYATVADESQPIMEFIRSSGAPIKASDVYRPAPAAAI